MRNDLYTAQDYWSLPEGVRAELIDGELWAYRRLAARQRIVFSLARELTNFIDSRGTCEVYPAPFAVNLFADVSVICDDDKLWGRGCEVAPDFAAEVVWPFWPFGPFGASTMLAIARVPRASSV